MPSRPPPLPPSKLGTKEYWDNLYTTELSNHAADPSDIGTCWFDDSDAEARILSFLSDSSLAPSSSFLDLGCGNGSLLLALRRDGWSGPMLGIDYSAQSIALAKQVAESLSEESSAEEPFSQEPFSQEPFSQEPLSKEPSPEVQFAQWDLIKDDPVNLPLHSHRRWDVVFDKGTFDAISLSPDRLADSYRQRLPLFVRPDGGLFLITSCNWTEDELRAWFEGDDFAVVAAIKYPTFTFGGVKGQTITTLCFQRGKPTEGS